MASREMRKCSRRTIWITGSGQTLWKFSTCHYDDLRKARRYHGYVLILFRLPDAPTTKIFCVYGHGKETEVCHNHIQLLSLLMTSQRSYWYTRGEYEYDEVQPDAHNPVCDNSSDCQTPLAPLNMPLSRRSWIDADYTDNNAKPKVMNGVKMGEGDGTVSLLSLGAMCVEGWQKKRWNPAGMRVVTVEVCDVDKGRLSCVSVSQCMLCDRFLISRCLRYLAEAERPPTTSTSWVTPHSTRSS